MLCIFKGRPRIIAGEIQAQVAAIAALEQRRNVQEINGARLDFDLPEATRRLPQAVHVSQNVIKADNSSIAIADFPHEHQFGNGVTCNARVRLSDGNVYTLSWCVFPDPAPPAVAARWEEIRAIFEDGP